MADEHTEKAGAADQTPVPAEPVSPLTALPVGGSGSPLPFLATEIREARPAALPDNGDAPSPFPKAKHVFGSPNKKEAQRQAPNQISTAREVLETVVFVVVLVLLLKTFAAEAFVIPTGSMATTLLGYNKHITCPKCGISYVVNCSKEVDPQESAPAHVNGSWCENCRYHFFPLPSDISWSSGDRVLVAKFLFDSQLKSPQRHQVVVFKYPLGPIKDHVPTNFIKRLIGLPGETLLIYYGRLYLIEGMTLPSAGDVPADDLWKKEYEYQKEYAGPEPREPAGDLITRLKNEYQRKNGKELRITLIRKTPTIMMALRRLVYDNDHQAEELRSVLPPHWAGEGTAWQADDQHGFRHGGQNGSGPDWLRYQHIIPPDPWPGTELPETPLTRVADLGPLLSLAIQRVNHAFWDPELITDFSAYNNFDTDNQIELHHVTPANWVGDLMLEARVKVADNKGELWLELSKGVDRFQASWNLQNGKWTLYRVGRDGRQELASKGGPVPGQRDYHIRFANVDERLTLWVDKSLPFGDGVEYEAPATRGPTANDLQPASIGGRGAALEVHELKLWRDTYYTVKTGRWDASGEAEPFEADQRHDFWSTPSKWTDLRRLPALRMFVQPGHYLCMGDNSPESSDSRNWGTVPERLMLGRALLVYYPFSRAGTIK